VWGRSGAEQPPSPTAEDSAARGGPLAFLRRRLRRRARHQSSRLILEVEPSLAARLRRAARAKRLRRRTEHALASLTPRERQVITLAARGQTNRQIAETLVIAPETVKSHLRNALAKLGLHTKAELRLLLSRLELHPDTGDPM